MKHRTNNKMNIYMKRHTLILNFLCIAIFLLLTNCRTTPVYETFTFDYTLESIGAYRIDVSINSNKEYKIVRNNIFLNRVQDEKPIYTYEGILSETAFKEADTKISDAGLFKMKDAYGFDDKAIEGRDDLLIQIAFTADGKEKFITIRDSESNQFDKRFRDLIFYMNSFIQEYGK